MPTSVGRIVNVSVKSFGLSSRKGRWGDDESVDFATGGQDETKVSAGQPAELQKSGNRKNLSWKVR